MHCSIADAIAFLAPGLVHQFGNLLLTIQGHALGLPSAANQAPEPGDPPGRARTAILTASDRGARHLRWLRRLLGEPEPLPGDALELVGELIEIARVPVREAEHRLEWPNPGAAAAPLWVDACSCTQLVGLTLVALVRAIPDGVKGTVRVSVRGEGAMATIAMAFVPPADSLPFPLSLAAVVADVTAFAARQGHAAVCAHDAGAIELRIPAQRSLASASERPGLAES